MAALAGELGVGDQVDRIGGAGVLGLAVVVVIGNAGVGIDHHVLEHGSEALGGGVDLGLGLLRDADRLGVAAALEVEDAGLRPAVLVVPDQTPPGLRGESG